MYRVATSSLEPLVSRGWLGALLLLATSTAAAGTLTATVTDRDGAPVANVVIYATSKSDSAHPDNAHPRAVMDQRDQRFEPHVLVVQSGTAVDFPNNDSVSHHVYSFSPAKSFELPLYKGDTHEPVVFDTPGVVDVGCNIHDNMEAHVLVVDSPYFTATDSNGNATLDGLPAGDYSVAVYSPRLSTKSLPAPLAVSVSASGAHVDVELDGRLRPPHDERNESLQWSHY